MIDLAKDGDSLGTRRADVCIVGAGVAGQTVARRLAAAGKSVLLAESGDGGFSLRELARRVGVTANASYRHFANKDALLQALASEGFRRLSAAQREAEARALAELLAVEG